MKNKKLLLTIVIFMFLLILFFNFYFIDIYKKKNIINIDINTLLDEPSLSYNKYHNNYIKVTGKISKIIGSTKIILKSFVQKENELNGHVTFNETSKLIIELNNVDTSNYKIYDYITVIGKLNTYNKESQELILINTKIEANNLYDNYEIILKESTDCNEEIILYSDNLYTYCIDNIYLDYLVDKYELSYVLKDKKISLDELLKNITIKNNYKIYDLEKINILYCNNEKYIIISKNKKINYSLCEE